MFPQLDHCLIPVRVTVSVENSIKGSVRPGLFKYYYFGSDCGTMGPVENPSFCFGSNAPSIRNWLAVGGNKRAISVDHDGIAEVHGDCFFVPAHGNCWPCFTAPKLRVRGSARHLTLGGGFK